MTESQTSATLIEITFHKLRCEKSRTGLHVLFQISVKEFKDKIKLTVVLNTVFELNDIVV
jgi:hypothetical protein